MNRNYEYKVGGSLAGDDPSYVVRQADSDLYQRLLAGELCYVFNSRQMGKSSLVVRTRNRLLADGVTCVAIDISGLGSQEINLEQWYTGIVYTVVTAINLMELEDFLMWWDARAYLSPVQRLGKFIEEVLLVKVSTSIVIFIDEIDSILSLDFPTDDFFVLIRSCYDKRSQNPEYNRLTFALVGVATPSDLIADKRRTPFNVGRAIQLHGFSIHEVKPLSIGLEGKVDNPLAVMPAVLSWTGGQPFLTQKLCQLLVDNLSHNHSSEQAGRGTVNGRVEFSVADWVESVVKHHIIENWESQDEPPHLKTIRDRVLMNKQLASQLLGLYQPILQIAEVEADDSPEQMKLRLTGLVVEKQGKLSVYNQIYASVFNLSWVERQLANLRPYAESFNAWKASNYQDTSRLLRGQALEDALKWAANKNLSNLDNQYLLGSQKFDKSAIQRKLEAEQESNQILATAREKAEKALEKERQGNQVLAAAQKKAGRILFFTIIGAIVSVTSTGLLARQQTQVAENKTQQANQVQSKLEESRKDYQKTQDGLKSAQVQLQKVQAEAQQKAAEVNQAKKQLQVASQQVSSEQEKAAKEQQEASTAKQQLSSAEQELRKKITESEQKKKEIQVAIQNLSSAKKQANEARQEAEKAEQISTSAEEKAQQALTTLGRLGIAHSGIDFYHLGSYNEAIKCLEQSLKTARKIKDRQGEGYALANLGNVYFAQGDYKKAIDFHQQHLALVQKDQDKRGQGQALSNLGNIYRALGDYGRATKYWKQSLVIAWETSDRLFKGQVLRNLGVVDYLFGKYDEAIKKHKQSLDIARQVHDYRGEGQAIGTLGNDYYALGDYGKAIEYLRSSREIAKETQERQTEGQVLGDLGNVYYALGDYGKAIDYYKQHLVIAREIQDHQGQGEALNNLGRILLHAGKTTEATEILFQAIENWESLRAGLGKDDSLKVSIFEEQARTYRFLQKALAYQNKVDEALEIAERGRARALVELLTTRWSSKSKAKFTTPKPPNIKQIQQIAKEENATLVEYSIIDDDFQIKGKQQTKESELFVWVIKPTGEVAFRRIDLKPLWQQQNISLADLIVNSRDSIGVRGGIEVSAINPLPHNSLKQLHELLIEPIADLLPTDPNAHIVFIPERSLLLVPFVALQDAKGKYLIEKHTIRTTPSIQTLDLTHRQAQEVRELAKDILIVGNPTMPSVPPSIGEKPQQLRPLPGTEKEARSIAALLNTQALIGNQANKVAVLQQIPQARFIHLATHGLFNVFGDFGIPGAIALAPSGKDNGLLTANEILDLKLSAELVVLSACDTANGRITNDGIIGLSRSFFAAGVPSMIVALWDVPDASTAYLMTEFYRTLQHNPDKAQALRQAMLTTMKRHPEPRDWAAFTLIGEAK